MVKRGKGLESSQSKAGWGLLLFLVTHFPDKQGLLGLTLKANLS